MDNASKPDPHALPENSPGPNPYVRPVLRRFGDAAFLTRAVGKNGSTADGGSMMNMSKTS